MLKVSSVQFDFSDSEGELDEQSKKLITDSQIGKVYEVDDEDDLADAISDATGWCVESVTYH